MNELPPLRILPRTTDDVLRLPSPRDRPQHPRTGRFPAAQAPRLVTKILPIVMSVPDFRDGIGKALEVNGTSLVLLPPHSAAGLGNLSELFRSVDQVDIVLLDCHTVRSTMMCRTITRTRYAGWGGPIFVIVGADSLTKIPVAMALGAAEFALPTTPPGEIAVRLSRLASSTAARDESVMTIALPSGSRLSIQWREHVVTCDDIRVGLTLRELQLFGTFVENVGRTFSTAEIARRAWGRTTESPSMTAAYISSLRKKLAWFGNRLGIRTIRGLGYRFEIPIAPSDVETVGAFNEK